VLPIKKVVKLKKKVIVLVYPVRHVVQQVDANIQMEVREIFAVNHPNRVDEERLPPVHIHSHGNFKSIL